ncbi:MAG: peptidylprolyl isomerase [Kiritimatiellia bacterium]
MPTIVATVNGTPIPQEAVDFELQRLVHFYEQQGLPEHQIKEQLEMLRSKAMEQAIGTKLLIDEAHQLQIPVSNEELDTQFETYVGQFGGDRDKLIKAIEQQGMTVESFKQELRQGAMINKLIDQVSADVSAPTDEEIKAHYEAHKSEYITQDRVLAKHILIKPESDKPEDKAAAKDKLTAIRARIVKGESTFDAEAQEHSDCPSGKSNAGSLGWFGRGMMVKEFENVAFTLPLQEVSDILETQFGYHIIVKTEEEKGKEPTFEELQDQMKEFLFHAKRGQAVSDHVEGLRAKADIKIG